MSLCNGAVCTFTSTWTCHCLVRFSSLHPAHPRGNTGSAGKGRAGAAQTARGICRCSSPQSRGSSGGSNSINTWALGTGCAGWERRNANEGGLGNAAGLERRAPGCSQRLVFSSRWHGSRQRGGEVGIRRPFRLRCLMRGEGFETAFDAESVAPLKGPVAEEVRAVPPAARRRAALPEPHARRRQDDPSAPHFPWVLT